MTDLPSRFWLISDMQLIQGRACHVLLQNFSAALTVMLYMNIYSVILLAEQQVCKYLTFLVYFLNADFCIVWILMPGASLHPKPLLSNFKG